MDKKMLEAVDKAIANLESLHGKGVVQSLDPKTIETGIPRISTGSFQLDLYTGGGVPEDLLTECWGPEGGGKSTWLTIVEANYQRKYPDKLVLEVDSEQAKNLHYATLFGLNVSKDAFRLNQPDNAEQAFDVMNQLIETGAIGLIGVDSIKCLLPKEIAELYDTEHGNKAKGNKPKTDRTTQPGRQAAFLSDQLFALLRRAKKHGVTIVATNQLRMKIGQMFGSPETQPGGKAVVFAPSLTMRFSNMGKTNAPKKGDKVIGYRCKVRIDKSRVCPPFTEVEFDVLFGKGIDIYGEIAQAGLDAKLFKKKGGKIILPGGSSYDGVKNVRNALERMGDKAPEDFEALKEMVAEEFRKNVMGLDEETIKEIKGEESNGKEDTEGSGAGKQGSGKKRTHRRVGKLTSRRN